MRAVWLHTGNPRALQNQRCSLPGGLARLSVASFVGLIGFVGLVHCLDHRILHCECVDLPACRVSSTPREREAWCKHGGWNTLCPSQTSRLQCRGCEAKAAIYSVNPTGSLPHTLCAHSFTHSYLPRAGRELGTTALRIEHEEKEKTWSLLLSGFTTRETCQHTK